MHLDSGTARYGFAIEFAPWRYPRAEGNGLLTSSDQSPMKQSRGGCNLEQMVTSFTSNTE
jgi:hypothetical protein